MVRDELIYATMEEIEQFLRGNFRIPTEERTNSSELLFHSSELLFHSSEVSFHSSEVLFRPSVENFCFSASYLQIPPWKFNLYENKTM